MTPRELMMKPPGTRLEVNCASDGQLRFLHWLGYWPERIDGPRQSMIKTLAPGFAFTAPPADQASYVSMVNR